MTTKFTAISIRANNAHMEAIRAVARKRGQTVGDFVRAAVDAAGGAELQDIARFFDALERREYDVIATDKTGEGVPDGHR
jgi:uncharacterized protein (DUF1778 family)